MHFYLLVMDMSQHLMNTYGRQPVTFVRGEGVWLWDDQGKRYLDGLAGVKGMRVDAVRALSPDPDTMSLAE